MLPKATPILANLSLPAALAALGLELRVQLGQREGFLPLSGGLFCGNTSFQDGLRLLLPFLFH